MRLKQRDDSSPAGPRRLQGRLYLGRMMTIVIHHQHARHFTFDLEPPLGAAELAERRRNLFEVDVQVEAYRDGDKRFEFKGSNGFMITFDINARDVAGAGGAGGY